MDGTTRTPYVFRGGFNPLPNVMRVQIAVHATERESTMKRYLAEHWDTVLCIGLSILLAVIGILAYFWMFPSE